jgi:hypothetical protein
MTPGVGIGSRTRREGEALMRGTLLVTVLIVLVLATSALAGNVGLGVTVVEPGLSLKVWSGTRTAFDVGAGWAVGHSDWIYAHGDYLWHRYELDVEEGSLPFYFGIGARVLLHEGDDTKIGVRVPLGLDYLFENHRWDIFIEVAPIIDLMPETDIAVGGGLGARYYF